jgi:iron complex transport system permease protein
MALNSLKFIVLITLWLLFAAFGLYKGDTDIPADVITKLLFGEEGIKESWGLILYEIRLPKVITATLAGAALSVAGLLMQTFFRNPLAGPYVLGVSSGASMGVALLILGQSIFTFEISNSYEQFSTVIAASIGSMISLSIILFIARWIDGTVTLLIIGLMINYFTGAMVSMLRFWSRPEENYMLSMWNLGSFSGVNWEMMQIFLPIILLFLFLSFFLFRPLDVFLLGERIAKSMGMNLSLIRMLTILIASVLAGATTAFCGPIAFVGLAVPHMARWIFKSARHLVLIPGCCLLGMVLTCLADLLSHHLVRDPFTLPINTVTSIIGTPIVLILIISMHKGRRGLS